MKHIGGMDVYWKIRGQRHDLSRRGMIMGIVNVTPDSFSDGGDFFDVERAVERGLQMVREGAEVLDVGGESTRPGALEVDAEEEMARVIPVIEALRRRTEVLISVDTMKGVVAEAALRVGADMVNDVNGLREPGMLEVVANSDAAVVVMHMKGEPRTMQVQPHYEDVVAEVREFFEERLAVLEGAGIAAERVALDAGFGFGKTLGHNVKLLRHLPELRVGNRPLLAGVSRKSMIAGLLDDREMLKRHWPTVGLTAWMRECGVEVMRVHEVRDNVHALRMAEAIMGV